MNFTCFGFFLLFVVGTAAKRRTYYIAAIEVDWSYTAKSAGNDTQPAFRKIVYRQFTDGYFLIQWRRPHRLGFFGPTLVAEVGDTVVVRFKNLATIPCNMIAQGVQHTSDSGVSAVDPGEQIIYEWPVPHISSPTYDDPSCVNRLYYSSVHPELDLNSGLVGTIIICKAGWIANVESDHHPPFVAYFAVTDEDKTHFSRNRTNSTTSPGKHYHINGFSNGTLHVTPECLQNTDTWYLAGISAQPAAFSVVLENHSIQIRSSHVTNVVTLTSGATEVIEVEENRNAVGQWRFYSKINEHYLNGMFGVVHGRSCGNQFGGVFGNWWNRVAHRGREEGQSHGRPSNLTSPKVRTYYLAAEETLWHYAPSEYNLFTGDRLTDRFTDSLPYYESGPYRVGPMYMKVQYFAYTNDSFTTKVPREKHHGFLGPPLKMERDEILRVVFKNKASRPYNVFADGIFNPNADPVEPGSNYTYEFKFVQGQQQGPSQIDDQCSTRTYFSNINPIKDLQSGLVGPLLICKPGSLNDMNQQIGIDREIFLHFSTTDENLSWYINHTLAVTTSRRNVTYRETPEFLESNKMSSINGFAYGNLLGIESRVGEVISLHVTCFGDSYDLHTIIIANQTFAESISALSLGANGDQASVAQSQKASFQMAPNTAKTVYLQPSTAGKREITTLNDRGRRKGMRAFLLVNTTDEDPVSGGNVMHSGHTRWYYIAAVEQLWDYTGKQQQHANSSSGNNTLYEKVIYEEYSDASFTRKKEKDPKLGLLGAVIMGEVGDTIKVVFQNQGCRPYSMHPHMMEFNTNETGDWVLQGPAIRSDFRKNEPDFYNRGSVSTGHTFTYTWYVPPTAISATSSIPSECISSFYYSDVYRERDIQSGLIGPLVLCNSGILGTQDDDVIRYDVDREFHVLIQEFDETISWYADANMESGHWNKNGSNKISSINGLVSGALNGIEMEPGERIAWHVFTMDTLPRSMYFEGDPVLAYMNAGDVASSYIETIGKLAVTSLLPGASTTLTMVPSSTGTWRFGDFAASSIVKGMYGSYHVRQKECSNPLGLESGLISNRQLTSSSVYVTRARFGRDVGKWKASYARLNKKGHINAWIPNRADRGPWIQVDLSTPMRVTGIVLQGTADGHTRKYITKFKVLYSIDNRHWAFYTRQGSDIDMVFQGNFFYNVPVTRTFSPHLLTRYIRLMPITWQNQPAVRMELLGCSLDGRCEDPQGIGSGKVPDSAFTASSEFLYKRIVKWEARFGRLNYEPKPRDSEDELSQESDGNGDRDNRGNGRDRNHDNGRGSNRGNGHENRDGGNNRGRNRRDTDDEDDRGRNNGNNRDRNNGNNRDRNNGNNRDRNNGNNRDRNNGNNRDRNNGNNRGGNNRNGRGNNRNHGGGPNHGRQDNGWDSGGNGRYGNGRPDRNEDYAPSWGATKNNRRQWIQVDLGHVIKVAGIVTQGVIYKHSQLFVKSFMLRYSLDGFNWNVYQDPVSNRPKVFRGNIEPLNPVTHLLQNPVLARFVRIQPWTWRGRIALRFEVLGCAVAVDENSYKEVTPLPEDCVALD